MFYRRSARLSRPCGHLNGIVLQMTHPAPFPGRPGGWGYTARGLPAAMPTPIDRRVRAPGGGLRARLCLAALLLVGPPAAAQAGSHFAPEGPATIANTTLSFHQKQGKVAVRGDGQRSVCAWASTVPYHDIFARLFDADGAPLTGEFQVNSPVDGKRQDEPTVAMDEHGHFLVAWSDRDGLDGFQMGVFARAYDEDATPFGPDFVATTTTLQSQWEPFAAARPGGGFVLGWSGNDDGDAFLRLFDCQGHPMTGEIAANTLDNNAQTDPVPAVARDGTTFVAWIDFGGYGGAGTQTNIFARLFDAAGVPLQAQEFVVNSNSLAGEQREPKTAADGLGHFVVTWEDRLADADGIDILARRYDASGAPLGAEFTVNTTLAGDQTFPAVAADWVGNFVITWQDGGDVRAQRYDAAGERLGDEFLVHDPSAGAEGYPDVELDWAGESFVFCYDAPGISDPSKTDVAMRRWRHAPLTLAGPVTPGATFDVQLDLPGGAGLWRQVLLALGTLPGIPLPDGRKLELSFDPLFTFVLTVPDGGGAFSGFNGLLDASASASASVDLPANGALVGLVLQASVVTLDLSASGLAAQLRHVAHPLAIVIE